MSKIKTSLEQKKYMIEQATIRRFNQLYTKYHDEMHKGSDDAVLADLGSLLYWYNKLIVVQEESAKSKSGLLSMI